MIDSVPLSGGPPEFLLMPKVPEEFSLGLISEDGDDNGYDGDSDEFDEDSDDACSLVGPVNGIYPHYYYYTSQPDHPISRHGNPSMLLLESQDPVFTLPLSFDPLVTS